MKIVVSLAVLCMTTLSLSSSENVKRSLSPESQALVGLFKNYLVDVERKRRDEHERTIRDTGRTKRSTSLTSLCSEEGKCGNIIQNFALVLDNKAGARMCKSGSDPTKILIQNDYDTSPYCQYLQSHFDVCKNKTAVMQIGCQFTCKKCKECDDDECKCSKHAKGKYIDGRYKCKCKPGFRGDGFHCDNINECVEKSDNCHKTRATCTDLTPFWKCTCKDGYSGDGITCEDVNECKARTHNCDRNAKCTNTVGSFTCHCNQHYEGVGTHCTPIDYCRRGRDDCHRNAKCLRLAVHYTCKCNTGYRNMSSPEGRNCTDIDECAENTHRCHRPHSICSNTIGSYKCHCKSGFEGDGKVCQWINPCTRGTHDCDPNASCKANETSLVQTCVCNDGFKSVGTTPGRKCADINECDERTHKCDLKTTTCNNTVGGYMCRCRKGYRENDISIYSCDGIDECTENLDNCHATRATCTDLTPFWKCTCRAGYSGDGVNCADIDECTSVTHKHNCHSQANCTNTIGSYTCKCNTGFEGNGRMCKDVDECARGTSKCSKLAICTNTIGSCTCKCRVGYRSNSTREGETCVNINECKEKKYNCSANAVCEDTPGSYLCHCKAGYTGNGKVCTDIDECERSKDNCHHRYASCSNTLGSYKCKCNKGYEGNGVNCTDIDECKTDKHNCDKSNGYCNNTIGSFKCGCKIGFEKDGTKCVDINECSRGTHSCHHKAECKNNQGSYTCECNDGYKTRGTPVGYECLNINECVTGTHKCHNNAKCTDTDGSYTCTCNLGFYGNGFSCKDINECTKGSHKCNSSATCYNNIGSYTCECNPGYTGDGFSCKNIDECKLGTHKCHSNANCTDTQGSYTCACKLGYTGDGRNCKDINECTQDKHNCHINANCINTEGSFICKCKSGFEGNGINCTNINDCELPNLCHPTRAHCDDTHGSYVCRCKDGYTGNGKQCQDINECSTNANNCSKYAVCTNQEPHFNCECKFGFYGNGDTCTGSRGKRFVVLFMSNIDEYEHQPTVDRFSQIDLVSEESATANISMSNGTIKTLRLTANQNIAHNFSIGVRTEDLIVESKGILVETSKIVSLIALNHDGFTSDNALVLPIDRLSRQYVVATTSPYDESDSDFKSQIAIATSELGTTTVDINLKLSAGTLTYHNQQYYSGSKLTINLDAYQTFQLSHNYDMTGTKITATKPVAVFAGNRCNKPNSRAYCSHLFEMIPPFESWDKVYIVPPNYQRTGILVRILTVEDTVVMTTSNNVTSTKNVTARGHLDVHQYDNSSTLVIASRPVLVMSFAKGVRRTGGDPYLSVVPGLHQFIAGYQFSVPANFGKNHISITIKKVDKAGLRLDGAVFTTPSHESPPITYGTKEYQILTYNIQAGAHKVHHIANATFGLMVYGDKDADAYGFPGNMLIPGKI